MEGKAKTQSLNIFFILIGGFYVGVHTHPFNKSSCLKVKWRYLIRFDMAVWMSEIILVQIIIIIIFRLFWIKPISLLINYSTK